MATENLIARVETSIKATTEEIWQALTDPEMIKQYMFGAFVESDWKEGDSIVWKGVWQGKPFEDKGKILATEENKFLQYTHIAGSDKAHTEHVVSIQLIPQDSQTEIILEQDQNKNKEEKLQSEKNWQMMLDGMKKLLEN